MTERSLIEEVVSGCAEVLLEAHAPKDGICKCGLPWPCEKASFALEVLGDASRCKRAKAVSLPNVEVAVEFDCILPEEHIPPCIWKLRK